MPKALFLLDAGSTAVKNLIDESMIGALQSGFDAVASGYTSIIKIALPAALSVFCIGFALRRGISFFRGIAG